MNCSNKRSSDSTSSPLKSEAIEFYIRLGFKVFPVHGVTGQAPGSHDEDSPHDSEPKLRCTCGEPDCKSPGKHPMTKHGFKNATDDLDILLEFFRKHPDANIGIATGQVSKIVVVDVDPQNGGNATFGKFNLTEEDLKDVPMVHSGGGGRHFYYRYPPSGMPKVAQLGPGVDLKHDGGYIIAPPSRHISGGTYHWDASRPILSVEQVPEFPQKLLDLIPKRTPATKRSVSEALWLDRTIEEGRRNTALFKIAVCHVKLGVPVRVLASNMYSQNEARCDPPLPMDEVKSIIKNSLKYRTGINFNGRACPLPSLPDVPKMTPDMLPDVVAQLALDQAHRLNSSIELTVIPMNRPGFPGVSVMCVRALRPAPSDPRSIAPRTQQVGCFRSARAAACC